LQNSFVENRKSAAARLTFHFARVKIWKYKSECGSTHVIPETVCKSDYGMRTAAGDFPPGALFSVLPPEKEFLLCRKIKPSA